MKAFLRSTELGRPFPDVERTNMISLSLKRTSNLVCDVHALLNTRAVFKFNVMDYKRSKDSIHYPVFPSLAVNTQHGFGNNNWKQLIFFILQKVLNDYAKILLSRHVAHWVRSCLLNEAYITHMFACLLPESPEDDSLPQLLGHVWTAWRILIFHIVHTLSITFKKRYCAHG